LPSTNHIGLAADLVWVLPH